MLGDGAALWLKVAAMQGISRIRVKWRTRSRSRADRPGPGDWALGHAAVHQRFDEGDLASILAANLDPSIPPLGKPGRTNRSPRGPPGGPFSAPPQAPSSPILTTTTILNRGGGPLTTTTTTTSRTAPPPVGVPTASPSPAVHDRQGAGGASQSVRPRRGRTHPTHLADCSNQISPSHSIRASSSNRLD